MIIKIVSKGRSNWSLNHIMSYIKNNDKCIISVEENSIALNEELNDKYDNEVKGIKELIDGNANNDHESVYRVLNYIANEDKIKKKYISGYLCNPETAQEEFYLTIAEHLERKNKSIEDYDGVVWHHMVQSFPEELDISDEEVHQCGIELLKKLKAFQGVVASHVHPEEKEDGLIHGKCKHNHIVFCAYKHPDYIDPEHPNQIKFYSNKNTYYQLQIWNDEIAIAHGLPVIVEPSMAKTYSWYESNEMNKGTSWKKRVMLDIDNAKRITDNWNEFVSLMEKLDYKIIEKKYVTYITPDETKDHKQRVRDIHLGNEYTKESIVGYFRLKNTIRHEINKDHEEDNDEEDVNIKELLKSQELFVEIVKNKSGKYAGMRNLKDQKFAMYIPLNNQLQKNSVVSYFQRDKIYKIMDHQKNFVTQITGRQLIEFYINKNIEIEEANLSRLEAELKEFNPYAQMEKRNKTYYRKDWVHYQTKKPYRINLYDDLGRRRNCFELLAMLAIILISKESINWLGLAPNIEMKSHPIYAKRDWKIQNMIDVIEISQQEKIDSNQELKNRLMKTGTRLSQIKRELKYKKNALDRMEHIHTALNVYVKYHDLYEIIEQMPKSMEKEKMIRENKINIESYKEAKSFLQSKNINTKQEMQDFEQRYDDIDKKLQKLNEQLENTKEDYRKLKKLEYNIQLAQNTQYACGVNYDYRKIMESRIEDLQVNTYTEEELEAIEKERNEK